MRQPALELASICSWRVFICVGMESLGGLVNRIEIEESGESLTQNRVRNST